jgi:signal transduction histidine kinase
VSTQSEDALQSLQLELEAARDERDLCRALLLSPTEELAVFLAHALRSSEEIRALLPRPTREPQAFRDKIDRLHQEVAAIQEAMAGLYLPSVQQRVRDTEAALREIQVRSEISGNDLLPAMVLLEDLCGHIALAADLASVHVMVSEPEVATAPLERSEPQLALALQRCAASVAEHCDRRVSLMATGLEDIPPDWRSTLFDVLSQLLRNAVEHGIEPLDTRVALGKPHDGIVVVEFRSLGEDGYELAFQDDGQGLDAKSIAEVAVRQGLLSAEDAAKTDPRKLAGFIFQAGLTTSSDRERRGLGMQIVRDQIRGLGGQIQVATKSGKFTRYSIKLPRADAATAGETRQRA